MINSPMGKIPQMQLILMGIVFLKKNNVWLLLNGSSNKEIKTLDENPIPCLSKNEIEWCEIVCDDLSDYDINNLNGILCSN